MVDIAGGRKTGATKFIQNWICLASQDPTRFGEHRKNRTQKTPQYSRRDVGGKVPACWLEGIFRKVATYFYSMGISPWMLGYDQFNGLDFLKNTTVICRFGISRYSTSRFKFV